MQAALPSRGAKGIIAALVAGVGAAACLNLATSGQNPLLTLLAYISPVCIFISGLGVGMVGAAISTGVVMFLLLLAGNVVLAVQLGITLIIPAALLSVLALRYRRGMDDEIYWYPTGYLLTALVGYALTIFLLTLLMMSGQEGGLAGFIAKAYDSIMDSVIKAYTQNSGPIPPEQLEASKASGLFMKQYFPSLFMISFVTMLAISGVIAQISLRNMNWALRTDFTLKNFMVPPWLIYVAITTFALSFIKDDTLSYFGVNATPVLLLPFFVLGLSVVHAYLQPRKYKTLWLFLFYIVLSLGWPALPVIALGAIEPFVNIRAKIGGKS